MQTTARKRPAWTWVLAAGAIVAGGLAALAQPRGDRGAVAPGPASSALSQGANTEFVRWRREQALIRAEGTAHLWRVLAAAPTLPGDEP